MFRLDFNPPPVPSPWQPFRVPLICIIWIPSAACLPATIIIQLVAMAKYLNIVFSAFRPFTIDVFTWRVQKCQLKEETLLCVCMSVCVCVVFSSLTKRNESFNTRMWWGGWFIHFLGVYFWWLFFFQWDRFTLSVYFTLVCVLKKALCYLISQASRQARSHTHTLHRLPKALKRVSVELQTTDW